MIHLHRHDSDSILDGIGTPLQYAKIAASFNHSALCQSNHATLSGSLKHIKACNEVGIMPINGVEAYFRPNRKVRDKEWRYKKWHLVLIAKNLKGWHNLIKITSEAYGKESFYQFPCVDWELMEKYSDGIICTTSCILGPLPFLIENGNDSEVGNFIKRSLSIYGDDFYFAIQPHDFDRQRAVNLEIVSLANKYGCPIVYEGDSHYPYEGWVETQKIAILTAMNKTVSEAEEDNQKRIEKGEEIYELWHDGLHLMDEPEVRKAFSDFHPNLFQSVVDEAIRSTDEIGAKIEPFLMDRSTKMPKAGNSVGDAERAVTKWCREGMERIGKVGDKVYEERLAYELEVINLRKNYEYIFLAADWIRWCRSTASLPGKLDQKRSMLITTRGSAAASLVCYTCEITLVDPIAHKFKFERFLNPERKGLPDIDFDFPSRRRNEAKEYLAIKYGENNIADVMAQQHFQPRLALKSSTKALHGFDSDAFNEIAEICHEETGLIDQVHDIDLEKMKLRIPELDAWSHKWPTEWREAVRLENAGDPCVSRISKHAAGVVITPGNITGFMPTIRSDENEVGYRTAWAERPPPGVSIVDDYGFVKIDALGLKGRDKHEMIIELYEKRTGKSIDLDSLPCLTDPYNTDDKVMDIFKKGYTLGIHQFSGQGITSYMKKVSPDNIVDLTAVNALYRPGPMGENGHMQFANRKHYKEEYNIPDPLKNILSETFGLMIFQEQVMEIFQVLMGYNLGQADDVRKMIDKENRAKSQAGRAKLDRLKKEFIELASKIIGLDNSDRLWSEILPYVGYSFNRPHSGSYSIQAYQDGWLKTYLSLEFYSVIMTQNPKISLQAIKEARNFDIKILPPDVNISDNNYTSDFENNALRYGLIGIKGIANVSADQVMKLRPYSSLEDFYARNTFKYSKVNKGIKEKLHDVGALDSLGGRADWSPSEKAKAETDLLGMALSPGGTLGDDEVLVISKIHSESEYNALEIGAEVAIGGVISKVKKVKTKKGKKPGREMAFIEISLGLDSFNCTLFPEQYEQNKEFLENGSKVMVSGKKDSRDIIVSDMMWVEDFVNSLKG
jgi:DNA polymerase III subunit alpha